MHALAAVLAPFRLGERGQHGTEAGLVEAQRLELRGDCFVEFARGLFTRAGHHRGGGAVALARRGCGLLQRRDILGAGIDGGKLLSKDLLQPQQIGDSDAVLAGQRPQREQPFFGLFQRVRIQFQRASCLG